MSTTPPPTPTGAEPKISVTVTEVAEEQRDHKREEMLRVEGMKEGGYFQGLAGAIAAGIGKSLEVLIIYFMRGVNKFMARFGYIVAQAQVEDAPEFYELLAVVVYDLTGVPVNAQDLIQALKTRGRLGTMDRVGTELFNLLAQEFVSSEGSAVSPTSGVSEGPGIGGLPAGVLTPAQGVDAAQRFLGFVMSFSIREGNAAFFSEMVTAGLIENYREYGAGLARNLGLGRLTRMALRPLIDTTLATPLEWALNKQYRPKRLSEATAVRAYLRGAITPEQLREELSLLGYANDKINAIVAANELSLTDSDLDRLVRWGVWTEFQAVEHLRRRGYSKEVAQALLRANDLQRADARVLEFVNVLERQVLTGVMNLREFRAILNSLPLREYERRWEIALVGQQLELPRRTLTLAQMRTAFLRGLVDLGEWRDFLRKEGYSDDDSDILTLALLDDARLLAEKKELQERREEARAARMPAALPPGGERPESTTEEGGTRT